MLLPWQQMQEEKQMERRKKIALELSELVVYCRPVPFNEESEDRWPSCPSSLFPHTVLTVWSALRPPAPTGNVTVLLAQSRGTQLTGTQFNAEY